MHSGPISFEFTEYVLYIQVLLHTFMCIRLCTYVHIYSVPARNLARYQKKYARLLKLDYVRDTVPPRFLSYIHIYIA